MTMPDVSSGEERFVALGTDALGHMKKEYNFSSGKRGPVGPIRPGKTRITIRLDDDVLDWFRTQVHAAGGGN